MPLSVFRFLMISVLLSLDKNWMMIGVVPSLRLGRSWMAVISISKLSAQYQFCTIHTAHNTDGEVTGGGYYFFAAG